MLWIRARRRALSSRGVQAGAILGVVLGVGVLVGLVWFVWFVGGCWWVEESWEWKEKDGWMGGRCFCFSVWVAVSESGSEGGACDCLRSLGKARE